MQTGWTWPTTTGGGLPVLFIHFFEPRMWGR
jgi:hypothetical protein